MNLPPIKCAICNKLVDQITTEYDNGEYKVALVELGEYVELCKINQQGQALSDESIKLPKEWLLNALKSLQSNANGLRIP